tara:strand:+ start:329 stop:619 length:291 start_codon:yes stop_codon:yes gene_type:complete
MAYIVKWVVTDKSGAAYSSVNAFFKTEDTAAMKQHIDLEAHALDWQWSIGKQCILATDGKSFVQEKHFCNEEYYNTWLIEKAKLPEIDKHLNYTLI